MKANCYVCGKEFNRRKALIERAKNPVCSRECQAKLYTKKIKVNCVVCGKEIYRTQNRIERYPNATCSRKCVYEFNKGKNSKVEIECPACKKFFKVWPYRVTRDQQICCSPSCATKYRLQESKNHPLYNPDISEDVRQKRKSRERTSLDVKWRRKILIRDNFTCGACGKNEGKMVSHHLNGYKANPSERLDLNNGVCLCRECHIDFHSKFIGNTTKEQFLQYANPNRRLYEV